MITKYYDTSECCMYWTRGDDPSMLMNVMCYFFSPNDDEVKNWQREKKGKKRERALEPKGHPAVILTLHYKISFSVKLKIPDSRLFCLPFQSRLPFPISPHLHTYLLCCIITYYSIWFIKQFHHGIEGYEEEAAWSLGTCCILLCIHLS